MKYNTTSSWISSKKLRRSPKKNSTGLSLIPVLSLFKNLKSYKSSYYDRLKSFMLQNTFFVIKSSTIFKVRDENFSHQTLISCFKLKRRWYSLCLVKTRNNMFSLMFLFSGRGYWQELIESILWSHSKLKVAPSIQPRALSITQGRAVGVAHYLLGGIATTWSFFLARIIAVG